MEEITREDLSQNMQANFQVIKTETHSEELIEGRNNKGKPHVEKWKIDKSVELLPKILQIVD